MNPILLSSNSEPMHWSIAGLIIGLIVPALLYIGNKNFGISSSLKHMCKIVFPNDKGFFNYDIKPHVWTLFFISGIAIGGLIAHFSTPNLKLELGERTITQLTKYNIENTGELYPVELYKLGNTGGMALLIIGGLLVGFGTRYANGCTSGHSIFGIAQLQLSSLIATIAFFVGGLIMTHLILPIIL